MLEPLKPNQPNIALPLKGSGLPPLPCFFFKFAHPCRSLRRLPRILRCPRSPSPQPLPQPAKFYVSKSL
uniref:Uncharacterized protein n=1 Tax=Tupiella akineta TaxID=160070 RepID=Q6UVQ3_TUPAK|nr:hypothetical protein PsakpMp58 [Tupiella akineta]AAQ18771.1 hypothetical protein [Tupiella akineta]